MKYLPNTNILCLERHEYVRDGIISEVNFRQQNSRNDIKVHGYGAEVLIEYESIPPAYKAKIFAKYGDAYEYAAREPLKKWIVEDFDARMYYSEYIVPHTGEPLPQKFQTDYSRQCDYLNLITLFKNDASGVKRELKASMSVVWETLFKLAATDPIKNRLPQSYKRLMEKYNRYMDLGYEALVENHIFGNQNAKKTNGDIEDILLSIYQLHGGRTTITQASRDYSNFLKGKINLIDMRTGELYNPADFMVKGTLQELSPASIRYYINKKHNREAIDMMKLGTTDYVQKHKPHNRRHLPSYALSTVTMDDYLPPFKTLDGKRTVWMYVVFDVASTAIVGVAYSTKKDWNLVTEALADMTKNCIRNGWGLPLELEMERHLNYDHRGSEDTPDIFTPGYIFNKIRFVRGGNSQGKKAERFLEAFKYSELTKELGFLGRPHGRNENFKYNSDAVEYHYTKNDLIEILKKYVLNYNNTAYKDGLTRWEWLCQNINPNAIKYPVQSILPYISKCTETSVHRGLVQVKNNSYEVPLNAVAQMQSSNGRVKVNAYYLPDENGAIDKVYLYGRNNKYICEAELAKTYNYSSVERTPEDWAELQRQTNRQKEFMATAKARLSQIPVVGTMDIEPKEVQKVRKEYDKLVQETEEYEMITGTKHTENSPQNEVESMENMHKTAEKMQENDELEGGYVQKFTIENIVSNAISSL